MALSDFIPQEGQKRVVEAIEAAEKRTSGEIRVHIEPRCKSGDAYRRAVEVFNELKMYETGQRNAVLVYVAYRSHVFAIIGDCGINERVGSGFWNEENVSSLGLGVIGLFCSAWNNHYASSLSKSQFSAALRAVSLKTTASAFRMS